MRHRTRGFTLMELLVVVAVLVILAGLILAALSVLRKMQRVASTTDLMTHMTTAIDAYLHQWPTLGCNGSVTDSKDFIQDPWAFLSKNIRDDTNDKSGKGRKQGLIDVPLNRLVTKNGSGSCLPAESKSTATHITDYFGTNPQNVFSFTILNHNRGNDRKSLYTQAIIFRSSCGSKEDTKDDVVYAWSSSNTSWRKIKVKELEDFAKEIDPVPTMPFETAWKNPLDD